MDNKKLLKQAIEYLQGLDAEGAESVQINNTKYDDGSTCIEVGVSFPAVEEVKITTDYNKPKWYLVETN